MAEEVLCNLNHKKRQRQFQGESPKEILTVFFSWKDDPLVARACTLEVPSPRDTYQSITSELLQRYSSDKHLLPKSTYRKAKGDGVRTITYWAHTSEAASGKSGRHVTKITEADIHQPTLTLCHRLAMTMPNPFPYLCITVVLLTDGEELSPHIQSHRVHRNATIWFGRLGRRGTTSVGRGYVDK